MNDKKRNDAMQDELCEECKKFHEIMNGGTASLDVFVVCDHVKKKIEFKRQGAQQNVDPDGEEG